MAERYWPLIGKVIGNNEAGFLYSSPRSENVLPAQQVGQGKENGG